MLAKREDEGRTTYTRKYSEYPRLILFPGNFNYSVCAHTRNEREKERLRMARRYAREGGGRYSPRRVVKAGGWFHRTNEFAMPLLPPEDYVLRKTLWR